MLIADAPAAVAALDDIDEALEVALVAVVVAREQVAVLVEHELLRIAQPARDELEVRAVGIRAEYRAFVRVRENLAFLALHVRPAVADRVVELAVVTDGEAVEIVARVVVAHAEAAQQLFLLRFAARLFVEAIQAR